MVKSCGRQPALIEKEVTLPVVLYMHGGGFVLGLPEMADDYLADLAEELKTSIVAVDYRLAPEHPFQYL